MNSTAPYRHVISACAATERLNCRNHLNYQRLSLGILLPSSKPGLIKGEANDDVVLVAGGKAMVLHNASEIDVAHARLLSMCCLPAKLSGAVVTV